MKILLYFLLVVAMVVSGCRDIDKCKEGVCPPNMQCVNEVCICDSMHTGANCSQLAIPVQSFIGDYHMTGSTKVYNSGTLSSDTPIDDTLTVTKLDDSTLVFNGFNLQYASPQPDTFYLYVNHSPYRNVSFQFTKPFTSDSAFYYMNDLSPFGGGATIVSMNGVKIQ